MGMSSILKHCYQRLRYVIFPTRVLHKEMVMFSFTIDLTIIIQCLIYTGLVPSLCIEPFPVPNSLQTSQTSRFGRETQDLN